MITINRGHAAFNLTPAQRARLTPAANDAITWTHLGDGYWKRSDGASVWLDMLASTRPALQAPVGHKLGGDSNGPVGVRRPENMKQGATNTIASAPVASAQNLPKNDRPHNAIAAARIAAIRERGVPIAQVDAVHSKFTTTGRAINMDTPLERIAECVAAINALQPATAPRDEKRQLVGEHRLPTEKDAQLAKSKAIHRGVTREARNRISRECGGAGSAMSVPADRRSEYIAKLAAAPTAYPPDSDSVVDKDLRNQIRELAFAECSDRSAVHHAIRAFCTLGVIGLNWIPASNLAACKAALEAL